MTKARNLATLASVNTTISGNTVYINGNISFANATLSLGANTVNSTTLTSTGVVANSYGNTTAIPVITIDAAGRITNATTSSVSGVTGLSFASANSTITVSTSTTNFDAAITSGNSTVQGLLKVIDSVSNTSTSIAGSANSVTTAYLLAANAVSNATAYAATAYSNAVATAASDATTKAGTAYTNATSYADTKAAAAYSNVFNGGTFSGAVVMQANLTANSVRMNGNLQIDGDLTVSGNTVSISVTNLSVEDNMIYLNSNSTVSHPDLGFTGNYNDGTYAHAGLFRDATDGVWKFFHGYTPEPDASVYIDTSNASFTYSNLQVNYVIGNVTGSANSATYVGGNTASTLRSYSDTIAGTAYSNAVAYAASNSYVNSTFLKLTGGTVTGNVAVSAYVHANGTGGATGGYFGMIKIGYGSSYGTVERTDSDLYLQYNNAYNVVVGYGGGYLTATNSSRAPIFYDSDNTAYYVNPASTSNIGPWTSTSATNVQTGTGTAVYQVITNTDAAGVYAYLQLTTSGSGSGYLLKNRTTGNSMTNQSLYLWNDPGPIEFVPNGNTAIRTTISTGGSMTVATDIRSPFFYDSDNTGYYINPYGTSNINQLNLNGPIVRVTAGSGYLNGNYPSSEDVSSSGAIYSIGGTYVPGTSTLGNMYGVGYAYSGSGRAVGANPAGAPIDNWGLYGASNGTLNWFLSTSTGGGFFNGQINATIFYDNSNTGYYVNPDSTSRFVSTIVGGHGGTAYDTASNGRLYIGTNVDNAYSIYTHMENYGGNYTKLTLDWHTGIKIGAYPGYGGVRFFNNAINSSGTQIFSVGETDNNVRVSYNLYTPIMYDSNNTGFYVNPNSGTNLSYLQVSGAWNGSPYGSAHEQFTIRTNYPSYTHRNTDTGYYWLVHMAADHTINWYGGGGGVDGSAWNRNLYLDMSGNLVARGNVTAYSDIRLKTNIVTIDNAIDKVKRLRGVYFDWIESGEHSLGMIAQEVEEVLPELVMTNTECKTFTQEVLNVTKSLDYSKIVSVLVEAVKEQQTFMEAQEARIAKLEALINKLVS